ncbi:hypothetical protein FKM82_021442 [Ascaphus truei]
MGAAMDTSAAVRMRPLTSHHHTPLFDSSIRELKKCRRLERRKRKSCMVEDKQKLTDHITKYQSTITSKKSEFLSREIMAADNTPAQLFCTVERLCKPACLQSSEAFSQACCENIALFFSDKVISIWAGIPTVL